jgi:uncharacterized protein YaiL (DUF2058 family)
MAISLKDQLLKAGLVDAKKARKAENEKKIADRQTAKGLNTEASTADLAKQAQAAKAEHDKALNKQLQAEKDLKALAAQIRQLIENHRLERKKGEIAYQFTDQKKIKKLYVDATQQSQLIKGMLAIVRLGEAYELVPAVVAEKIASRDAAAIVLLNTRAEQLPEDDDPYADYKIPDDLMW